MKPSIPTTDFCTLCDNLLCTFFAYYLKPVWLKFLEPNCSKKEGGEEKSWEAAAAPLTQMFHWVSHGAEVLFEDPPAVLGPRCGLTSTYLSQAWLLGRVKKKADPEFFDILICGLLFCLAADAFFKAAISLVPEVPKMINIDGKMRPSESFLLEFLCNFFSTLLIVPVRFPRRPVGDIFLWPVLYTFFALEVQGCSVYIFVGFVVRYLHFSMHFYSSMSRMYSQGSLYGERGTTCSGLEPLDEQNTQGEIPSFQLCSVRWFCNITRLQFPHLQNGHNNSIYMSRLRWGLSEQIYVGGYNSALCCA